MLEHLSKPLQALLGIHSCLKDNSVLFIGVPGIKSVGTGYANYDFSHYFKVFHLYHFSLGTLRNIV